MLKQAFLVLCGALFLIGCDDECINEFGECPDQQLQEDLALIDEYLTAKGLEAEVHPSGLHYIILEEGDGETPNNNQEVVVNYTGRFLDGRVFDTSLDSVARAEGIFNENRDYQPFQFTLGIGRVIPGWDIGIGLLNEGAKAQLLLPSYLAYGPSGSGASIPGNTVLTFEVELLDIKF